MADEKDKPAAVDDNPKENHVYLDEEGLFKKGNPGGPGRPLGAVSLLSAVKREIRKHPKRLDQIARNLIKLARDGDHRAIKAIDTLFNRLDGPIKIIIEERKEKKPGIVVLDHAGAHTVREPEEDEDDGIDADEVGGSAAAGTGDAGGREEGEGGEVGGGEAEGADRDG